MSFEYRTLARSGYCRVCDYKVQRDVDMVITFQASREQVVICTDCIEKITRTVERENLDDA